MLLVAPEHQPCPDVLSSGKALRMLTADGGGSSGHVAIFPLFLIENQ